MPSILSPIRRLLERWGCYPYVRHSVPYHWWLKVRNPSYLRALHDDEQFYRQLLGKDRVPLIFDVGANVGDKAHVFSRLAERVICFEPDPRLAHNLRIRFRHQPQVVIVQAAVSDHDGHLPMHTYDGGSAYNTLNSKQHDYAITFHQAHQLIEVPLITLKAAIDQYGMPDFLKVDVEGHEWEVFSGLTQLPPLLSFEANLPTFQNETLQIISHLTCLVPNLHFTSSDGGGAIDASFSQTATSLSQQIIAPDCPAYLEIFARHP